MPSLRPLAPEHGPEATVLGSWDGRAVHVWGWDGGQTLPVHWLYRGFRQAPWPGSPLASGALSSITVELPGGRRIRPTTARLDATSGPHWLAGITALPPPGDSMAWFATIARLAAAMLDTGRVGPLVTDERSGPVARWHPIVDGTVSDVLEGLAAAMPSICVVGTSDHDHDTGTGAGTVGLILGSFVDGLARRRLALRGWRPPLAPGRSATASATRAIFTALASGDGGVRTPSRSATEEIGRLAERLDRDNRRARGEPVVMPRLRLVVPDDPGDDWHVALEVVDELDPGRWCSADDVWDATALAVEVAGEGRHLPVLASTLSDAAVRAAAGVTVLADWARQHEPSTIDLDLEAAESFLVEAPAELAARRIELIGPERLVRSNLRVRGRATQAPASDRRAGFGREAVVQWTLCAADEGVTTALSEAELARAVAAGATLLHTGRRWVRIDPAALRRANEQLDAHQRDHGRVDALTLLRLSADEQLDVAAEEAPAGGAALDGADAAGGDGWVADLLGGLPDERLREEQEPESFAGALRPYQQRGLAWLRFLARLGLGGCLADDMGLGKTATTLAHLLDRPGPHLVVCPLSVVHNWEAEAGRFAPKLRVVVHHGAGRLAREDQPRLDAVLDDGPPDVVVTTYGLLTRDIDHLAATPWTTVVLDEAQMVKNPSTNAARAVRQLRAEQKLALTGTPVENRLSELWAILDAVNPGLLGSRERFRHRFGKPIERDGDADAAATLRRLTQPFVLRRTKADRQLVPDLPDKIEQIAWAGLTKEQALLYQQVVEQLLDRADAAEGMKRRGLVLAALTRLKQICNHPVHVLGDGSRLAGRSGKLTRFDELVDELLDLGERALVFTQFREMGELLRRHTAERLGLRVPFLHGGVTRTRRDTMVAEFQAGLGPPLLLISLKAGGTGLNLTAASQVIHYDRWWNPAVEDQATDRAWRIGQGRTVVVHKMVCEGTVEERIATMIDEKRALADAVVGSGETWLSELSTAELRELVRLDAGGGT